jgi:hypothetical protein
MFKTIGTPYQRTTRQEDFTVFEAELYGLCDGTLRFPRRNFTVSGAELYGFRGGTFRFLQRDFSVSAKDLATAAFFTVNAALYFFNAAWFFVNQYIFENIDCSLHLIMNYLDHIRVCTVYVRSTYNMISSSTL